MKKRNYKLAFLLSWFNNTWSVLTEIFFFGADKKETPTTEINKIKPAKIVCTE